MKETNFKMVPLKDLVPSKTNPRKLFDTTKTIELAESIREKGVLQPILVRTKGNKFEIVCGERRYRASQMVATLEKSKDSIPAIVRELTDQEVREMQLIENFQREDVHPMEEAVAIKYAIGAGGYSLEDLMHKVGKSLQYVKQRMKLNALAEKWQELFFNGNFNITTALKIAQFPSSIQDELLNDRFNYDELKNSNTVIELNSWTVDQYKGKLSEASFDINDASLDKKMGACSGCSFNTAFALLFPDDAAAARCTNISCFKNKTDIHFKHELAKAKEDPSIIFVSDNHSSFDDKKLCADLIAEGHDVLLRHNFEQLEYPEKPDWEDFKEMNDFDEASKDEQSDLKAEFDESLSEYEKDLLNYQRSIEGGKYKKAFVVDGDDKGKYYYIKIRKSTSSSSVPAADKKIDIKSETLTAGDIDSEIERIKQREKRSKEIDANTIWNKVKDLFDPEEMKLPAGDLSQTELNAIALTIHKKSTFDYHFEDAFKFDDDKIKNVSLTTFIQMLRFFMLAELPPSVLYQGNTPQSLMSLKVAEEYFPAKLKEIQDSFSEKINKRIGNVNKRIADLQTKKKELLKESKPVATKKPAAKKSTPKKAAKKK